MEPINSYELFPVELYERYSRSMYEKYIGKYLRVLGIIMEPLWVDATKRNHCLSMSIRTEIGNTNLVDPYTII